MLQFQIWQNLALENVFRVSDRRLCVLVNATNIFDMMQLHGLVLVFAWFARPWMQKEYEACTKQMISKHSANWQQIPTNIQRQISQTSAQKRCILSTRPTTIHIFDWFLKRFSNIFWWFSTALRRRFLNLFFGLYFLVVLTKFCCRKWSRIADVEKQRTLENTALHKEKRIFSRVRCFRAAALRHSIDVVSRCGFILKTPLEIIQTHRTSEQNCKRHPVSGIL